MGTEMTFKPYMAEFIGVMAVVDLQLKKGRKTYKFSVLVEATSFGNDGIGSYECHGFKGNDRGSDYVEEYEITDIIADEPINYPGGMDVMKEDIYRNDDLYEKINESLMGKVEDIVAVEEQECEDSCEQWDTGLCPICGEKIKIIGETKDGRFIGSCNDAFTADQWSAE